jgi:hypothetical protein
MHIKYTTFIVELSLIILERSRSAANKLTTTKSSYRGCSRLATLQLKKHQELAKRCMYLFKAIRRRILKAGLAGCICSKPIY